MPLLYLNGNKIYMLLLYKANVTCVWIRIPNSTFPRFTSIFFHYQRMNPDLPNDKAGRVGSMFNATQDL